MVKNPKKDKISAIVICGGDYDKKLFELSKKSLSWCDELIVVNGNKGTFSDWRNEGLKKANGDWVLYIDSDEEVSSELCSEIVILLDGSIANKYSAFAIPRKNFIFNKEFKHGGQYPDYQKRLFKKKSLKKWVGDVHEEPVMEGEMGHLKNPIIHHKNITITQMIEKTNAWSEIEADLMFKANHPKMNAIRFLSSGFREFWLRFVKQLCFLDGTKGTIYGIYQIYSRLISYSKLWEMQIKVDQK